VAYLTREEQLERVRAVVRRDRERYRLRRLETGGK
jgi:hypothetical protein